MLGGLLSRLRAAAAEVVRAAAGDDVHDAIAELRERALSETVALRDDGAELAQRIRRNASSGRSALGGERPL
jgi:predicted ArsR family transcriptional regulator